MIQLLLRHWYTLPDAVYLLSFFEFFFHRRRPPSFWYPLRGSIKMCLFSFFIAKKSWTNYWCTTHTQRFTFNMVVLVVVSHAKTTFMAMCLTVGGTHGFVILFYGMLIEMPCFDHCVICQVNKTKNISVWPSFDEIESKPFKNSEN